MELGLAIYRNPPSLLELRFAEPSEELYKRIFYILRQRYKDFIPLPPLEAHNHYAVVVRECPKNTHTSGCLQKLYVACPRICCDHVARPVSREMLRKVLEGYLH